MGYMKTMVDLSDQMRDARNRAMTLHGSNYPERVEPYKSEILKHMAVTGLAPLDVTLRLAKTSIEYHADPLLYLAAGVELVMIGGAA